MTARTHILSLLLWGSSHAFAPPTRAVVTTPQHARRPLTRTYATESDEELALYGAGGVFASAVVLYSEFTLKTTGCGLPAGPFGAVGAAAMMMVVSSSAGCEELLPSPFCRFAS